MEKHTTVITSDEPVTVTVQAGGGHWFRILCVVIESGAWARMSDSARAVYVVLAKHCASGRWIAWPSIATIGRLSGVSRRRIFYAVAELEGEGLLKRHNRGGGRQSTTYELRDLPETPSLPFPVRDSLPVPLAAPHPCRGRHPTRAVGGTRSRGIELEAVNNSNGAAAGVVKKLTDKGVELPVAVDLVKRFGEVKALAAVRLAEKEAKRNPAGFIRSALERGFVRSSAAPVSADALRLAMGKERERSELALERFNRLSGRV